MSYRHGDVGSGLTSILQSPDECLLLMEFPHKQQELSEVKLPESKSGSLISLQLQLLSPTQTADARADEFH